MSITNMNKNEKSSYKSEDSTLLSLTTKCGAASLCYWKFKGMQVELFPDCFGYVFLGEGGGGRYRLAVSNVSVARRKILHKYICDEFSWIHFDKDSNAIEDLHFYKLWVIFFELILFPFPLSKKGKRKNIELYLSKLKTGNIARLGNYA